MANQTVQIRSLEMTIGGISVTVSGGMFRHELVNLLGEPDDVGAINSKHSKRQILLYGEIEFHFDQNDRLFLVYSDSNEFVKLAVSFDRKYEWKN